MFTLTWKQEKGTPLYESDVTIHDRNLEYFAESSG